MANTKVTGDVIANGTISTVHIADDAITAAKLDSTATGITFADLAVDTDTLYVDSANNRVGIGTTLPTYSFHITGSGDTVAAVTAGTSSIAALNLGNSTNLADGGIRYDNSADALIFRAANAEKMRINSSGNSTFTGTIDAGGRVKVSGGNTDQYYFEGSRNGVGVTYRLYDNANNIYHDSYTSQVFRLNQNGGSGGNLIITGGNVGIGTASPDLTGFGYTTLTVVGGTPAGYAGVLELGSPTTNANGQNLGIIAFMDGSTRNAQIDVTRASSTSTSNMHFYTNGGSGIVERMRITSDGQVTVTGTSTTMKLYNGSSFTGVLHFGNADFLLGFDSGVFKQRIWDGADYFNAIEYNGSSHRLILAPSEGSVGIGTTSPSARLNVYGTGTANDPTVAIDTTSSSTFNHAIEAFNANLTANEGNYIFVGKEGSLKNTGYIGYKYSGTSGSNSNILTFGHWASDNLMNLTGDGKLGIGTESPGHKLDVSGKIRSTGGMETTYMDFTGPSSQIGTDTYTNGFYVYDNSAYRMVIKTGTGYVGIGYVNPNQRLDVNGNIGIPGAGKIVINNEPTAWFFQGRTTDSTSFLGTNLKNLLYCGGGASEGFAIAGTGTGDASFEIKNNGDAKIKTRLGIGTTDYQNSVLHAAGTISLESLGYNTFDALNTGSGGIWSKIGTWYTAQGGRNLSIKLSAGSGYNASLSQNGEVYIELRTSNGSAAAPNISGRYWTLGINEYISNVRVKEINQGEYEIYIQAGAYIGQGQIQAVHSLTDRFDRSISYNTGTPGGTVLSLTKYYYLRSPFYCYYDITTTEDIYIDSGTNYNDIGYLYLSNGRSSVSSEVVSGTAQGDTNLAFTTRYNGSAHTAGTFTHFGYFKAKGRNKTSFTYGSGYTFHNIESHEANEPTLVVHNSINTGEMYGINVIHTLDRNNTTSRFYAGQGAGTERIKIYSNGNIQNSNNSYGQLSDETIKENIIDATPKLDEINQVRVVNFNYIGEEQKQIGVVAQELEQIFPGLVYEAGNTEINENGKEIPTGETTKAVKYSVFVPILIKAIQEQQQIINDLKNRIQTLENN